MRFCSAGSHTEHERAHRFPNGTSDEGVGRVWEPRIVFQGRGGPRHLHRTVGVRPFFGEGGWDGFPRRSIDEGHSRGSVPPEALPHST